MFHLFWNTFANIGKKNKEGHFCPQFCEIISRIEPERGETSPKSEDYSQFFRHPQGGACNEIRYQKEDKSKMVWTNLKKTGKTSTLWGSSAICILLFDCIGKD